MKILAKTAGATVLVGAFTMLGTPSAGAQPECVDVGGATRCSNPGNVQINATPTQTGPYLPYGCVAAYSALCYEGLPGIHIDTSDHNGGGGGGGGRHPHHR
ncbi:hypothetical protein [Mycolicibacterium sp. XJ870]